MHMPQSSVTCLGKRMSYASVSPRAVPEIGSRLHELRTAGALTEAEFEEQKRKLLGQV